jgi:hypothetical protein
MSGNVQGRPIIGLPRGRKSNTSTTAGNDEKHIEELDLDLEINRERPPSTAERNTLTYAATSQNNTSSHYFNKNNSKRDSDDVNMDVENLGFNFLPTARQLTRLYRSSPSTSVDVPLRSQSQRQQEKSFDFDFLDEIDPDQNQPPAPAQQESSSRVTLAPPLDLKGKGRAEPYSPFVDQSKKSQCKIDDAGSDDYGMMEIDDNDFANPKFVEDLYRVEMEALGGRDTNGAQAPSLVEGVGLPSSSVSMGESSGSYVLVDGDKKISSSASISAPITSSSSTKPIKQLEIIEIDSDEDDEMLDTDDKENEPVATRHVKRRMEDLDEEVRERGRGLLASQGWDPPLSGSSRITGLKSQTQNQNRSQNGTQGLKSRVLAMSEDVIDLSDSDDD